MALSKPRISIVIPTYNRAHLLPMAVRSVLQQTFEDFEIVISNGGSTDNTSEVVQRFNDPRIKYFESKERLKVGDNYQNGLDHASGEFITFLSDDDAYSPGLLETVKVICERENAEIVGYTFCKYYHDSLREFDQHIPKNSLAISPFDGKLTEFTPDAALEQVMVRAGLIRAAMNPKFINPYLSNATYHKSVFEQIRKYRTNLFDTVPPDEYLDAAVFLTGRKYYCLDLPLLIWSSWTGNTTVSAQRDAQGIRERYEQLLDGRQLEFTPLKFALPFNCGVNAVLEAIHDAGQKIDIDWAEYFLAIYRDLILLSDQGVGVADELRELSVVLENDVSENTRNKVQQGIRQVLYDPRFVLKRKLPRITSGLKSARNFLRKQQTKILSGDESGFHNVLEAAASLQLEINRITGHVD